MTKWNFNTTLFNVEQDKANALDIQAQLWTIYKEKHTIPQVIQLALKEYNQKLKKEHQREVSNMPF